MFVISKSWEQLQYFHVLLPFWFLLCFFTSSHNLMMVHVRFFWVDRSTVPGDPQWRTGIQNNFSCSRGIVLIPPAECFWAGETKADLGLLFEVVTACMCCAEIAINLSCEPKKQKIVLLLEAQLGQVGGGTDLHWRQNTCHRKHGLYWFALGMLISCTRMFFNKRVLLQLQLHYVWLLTYRPKLKIMYFT